MNKSERSDKFSLPRRSSAHSAYWMSNALVPAGLIMIYRHGLSLEGVLGLLFIGIGLVGFSIYKQKMSVPLIRHNGSRLFYNPSASKPCAIKMDSSAKFIVRELGMTAEYTGDPVFQFEISRLDFNSNDDWYTFIGYLQQEPVYLLITEV